MLKLGEIVQNTVVITSTFVMNDKEPILIISCDDDENGGYTLQFHSGNGDYDMEKILLVSVSTILKEDPSLNALMISIGEEFTRKSTDDEWILTSV